MLHSCSLHRGVAARLILVWPDWLADLITNQLTNSMDQSCSWEADSSPISQETSYIFWNMTVPYHFQWSFPLVAVLNHISPVDTLSSYVLKIQYIILLFMPRSSRWLFSFRFPHQSSAFISLLSYTCHPSCVSHSCFNQIVFGEDYEPWSSWLCSFLQCWVTSSVVGPNMFLSTHFLNTFSLCSSLNP